MSINQIMQASTIIKHTILFLARYRMPRHRYSHNNAFSFLKENKKQGDMRKVINGLTIKQFLGPINYHCWKYPSKTFYCSCSFKITTIKTVIQSIQGLP